ncbi:hypothetical protein EVAR_961_1 [Eumeta japonica]|uniref:Uncharacterized protein n=1 Tax=Eumeta variegata TaxID=151549 RepID=A0A4C1SE69_EUMVA|nr:hypothetical protein EVAR_961_1 [Eumeta japonica]
MGKQGCHGHSHPEDEPNEIHFESPLRQGTNPQTVVIETAAPLGGGTVQGQAHRSTKKQDKDQRNKLSGFEFENTGLPQERCAGHDATNILPNRILSRPCVGECIATPLSATRSPMVPTARLPVRVSSFFTANGEIAEWPPQEGERSQWPAAYTA